MKSLSMFLAFLTELYERRSAIIQLTKRDFTSAYIGSYLGILWTVLLPMALTGIFWIVYQYGFRAADPVPGYPYILWLICGMFPWFFFQESIMTGTNSILQNSFIVRKVAFSIGILPLVKIISALIIHVFFIGLIFVMFYIYGFSPDLYVLQVFYYLFCSIVLLVGITWLTSSIVIFFRDLRPLVQLALQIGFYLTPIFWDLKMLPPSFHFLLKFNPVFYIVQGYRESFIHKMWFWEHWGMTLVFWLITGSALVVGAVVFRRLRPHFADVL